MGVFNKKKAEKPTIKNPIKTEQFGDTYMLLSALEMGFNKADAGDKVKMTSVMSNGIGLYIEANYDFDNDMATKLAAVAFAGLYSEFIKEADEHGFPTAILHLLLMIDKMAEDDGFKVLHGMVMEIERQHQK